MGIVFDKNSYCGYESCPEGFSCGKIISNPNYGVTNFDNILYSFLQVFICVTVEGFFLKKNTIILRLDWNYVFSC